MFSRYLSAVSSGTLMTFALLYIMQMLISLQPAAAIEVTHHRPVDFVMIKDPGIPVQPTQEDITREDLSKTIEQPARPKFGHEGESIAVPGLSPTPRGGGHQIDFGGLDNNSLVNMVRVRPVYPAKAAAQGIEGYAIVQFDVGADGLVTNVVVVESSHSVFHREAIKAAQRFKYRPRRVDGVAIASTGIRNLFTFRLEGD